MNELLKLLQTTLEEEAQLSQEYQAASRALSPYYDAVKEALGFQFMDELCDRCTELRQVEVEESFARGFRAGGQLALEMLSRYSS